MKTIVIWLIRLYKANRTRAYDVCRFTPSCSEYAIEALETHGFWRGSLLATKRFLRCRPRGDFGPDPVPHPHLHKGTL
ncbi:MAG: membrane protein insertion efficiency factor YidD [Acidimicrobiia bacterium]